jgi:hypothetical protein
MANRDQLRGLWPLRHLTGGEIRTNEYTVTTGEIIYKGDLVKIVAGGTVEIGAAAIGTAAIGVASEYVDDSLSAGGVLIRVWDDPNIVFGLQCVTGQTPAATDVGATGDHIDTTGDTVTKLSKNEFNTPGTNAQLKIIGLVRTPDNAWGEHADLEVIFNEHHYKAAVAGV